MLNGMTVCYSESRYFPSDSRPVKKNLEIGSSYQLFERYGRWKIAEIVVWLPFL